jgi:hypothetical protein
LTISGLETQFTFHSGWADRTDIEIAPPAPLNMFGQPRSRTDLSSIVLANARITNAVECFDATLAPQRDSFLLLFFSLADAITSGFRLQGSLYSGITESTRSELVGAGDDNSLPDAAAIPRQIVDWLGLTYDQLATITGISRATFFYWRRPGAQPRPDSVRGLQQLYASTSLLVRRFGASGARAWLHSGPAPAWEYLIAGDFASLEDRVRSSLFATSLQARPLNRLLLDEASPVIPAAPRDPAHSPHRSKRVPKRGRITGQ